MSSLDASRLDDTVRASAAARRSAAPVIARPAPITPHTRAAPDPAASSHPADGSGSPVASTRAAADGAARTSAGAATSGGGDHAATPAAPGPARAAGAAPAGGALQRRGSSSDSRDLDHQRDTTLTRLALPQPRPATGGSSLGRESIAVDLRIKPFIASTIVPVPVGQRPATGKDGKPLPNPNASPAAAATQFSSAIGSSRGFYDTIISAARLLAADAVRDNLRAGDRARSELDRGLADIAAGLANNRISNDRAREFALEKVQALASTLRRRINRAAGSAFGRLATMRQTYQSLMAGPRGARVRISDEVSSALADTSLKAGDAQAAIQQFAQSPSSDLTEADFPSGDAGGDAVARAKLEAALQYIVPYITADDTAIGERLTAIEGVLNPLNDCLPCQMDGAFQLLDMRMDHLATAGPRAVAASRDGAIQSVHDLVERLTLSIEDTHRSIERQLVAQHDRLRHDLIDQSRLDGATERQDIRSMAQRQADALTAVAEGQSLGVVQAQQRLASQAAQGGGDYSGMLLAGAKRLSSNVAGMQRRYPAEQLASATSRAAGRRARQGAMAHARSANLANAKQTMADMVRTTFADLNANTEVSFAGMHDTPDRVRSSCESFLGPAEAERNIEVAQLNTQVNDLGTRVSAAISGMPGGGGGAGGATADVTVPTATPAPAAATSPTSAGGAGSGAAPQPMPPPASCGGCPSAGGDHADAPAPGAAPGPGATASPAAPGAGSAPATSASGGTTTTAAPNASPSPGGNYMSSVEFRRDCDTIVGDPKLAPGTAAFITRVNSSVQAELLSRANGAYTALDHWRGPDPSALMDALRGLSAASGAAASAVYALSHGSLVDRINTKFDDAKEWTFSDPDTIEWNRNAALGALSGDITGAAMNELRASFNWSNEDARIRTIMGSLTPAQMAALPASELDQLATQLDGDDLARFNAMRNQHSGGTDRAVVLRDAIDRANRSEGDARGRAISEAVRQARNSPELAIEGPADRQLADVFHLEHPDITGARRAATWHATLAAFGQLDGVRTTLATIPEGRVSALPPGSAAPAPAAPAGSPAAPARSAAHGAPASGGDATATTEPAVNPDTALEDALIRYATRDIYHPPPPPPPRGGAGADMDFDGGSMGEGRTDHVAPDMLNWIEQSVRHGPDSIEARGAQLLVEYNRAGAHGSAERVDAALHIGSSDAREGGHGERGSSDAAERDRDQIFAQFARFRSGIAGESFIGPIDVSGVRDEISRQFEAALPNGSPQQSLALGIIAREGGDPDAAINYAIATENPEMALRYLRRMDRVQIDAMLERWNTAHPSGPSLYEKLGLGAHHWSITNWNGATFSGDEANELEIAFMGVPQNDQQRGEVALRTMNQQIEQSTGLGRLMAGNDAGLLQTNRDALLRLMGHSNGDFGPDGRLRSTDPITGESMALGNFDAQGNFLPAQGRSYSAFETAVALSRITANNFVASVDAAANFVTTLLVVAAAVITTALTGGAAASIWIPMLVTAAAGLAGVAMTAAIKGGRYSRDEVVRDLVMTAVQTVTAGIGAAGSVAARGGMPALRAVASRGISQGFRISERSLERFVISKGGTMAATASLGADLGIAAASGALSGGVGAAIDRTNRRSGDYGDRVWGAIFRGAAGAAVGSGVARGAGAALGRAGTAVTSAAARSTARNALAAGMSREQAVAQALLMARRANWMTSGVTRAISSGASGSASRVTELGLEGRASFNEILAEGRSAFLQNMLQGALEHGADPGSRNPFRRGGGVLTDSEIRGLPSSQREEYHNISDIAHAAVARQYDAPRLAAADASTSTSTPSPAANDNEVTSTARPTLSDPSDQLTVPIHTPAEGESIPTGHSLLTGDPGMLGPALHPDGAEPVLHLRSEGDDFDPEKTNPGFTVTPPSFARGVDLSPGGLDHVLPLIPGTKVRGTNPLDGDQALINYEVMRARQPDHEVLLAHHPGTGDYYVIQGKHSTVAAPPEGYITIRHTHPEVVGGDAAHHFLKALPSGIGGDCSVLAAELDRMHGASTGMTVRRSSIIDITINGERIATTFEITRTGTNYELSVTLNPRVHGVESLGPFSGSREEALLQYAIAARQRTEGRSDFGQSRRPDEPAAMVERGATESRVVRNATPSEVERHDAAFVAARMAQADAFDQQARGLAARGEVDPILGRAATTNDAHERVRAMGLVGEPDSLARLTRLLNAPPSDGFPPEMRSALARATLEATRAEMIRTGALAPGDELLMLFRGVTGARTDDYEREGINLAHLGPGKDEDASRGLYGSQDFESALRYTGSDGQGAVLPLIVRQSELGNVIDVRSGTPLGDRWLAFLRARTDAHSSFKGGYDHLIGQLSAHFPISHDRDGRGTRYEAFLAELAADPTLPDAIRSAARDPHITLMDLGGAASTGNDRGILTDQFAMHQQRIADMFNEAHGFPVPGREGAGSEPLMLRSETGGPDHPPTPPAAEPVVANTLHPANDVEETTPVPLPLATDTDLEAATSLSLHTANDVDDDGVSTAAKTPESSQFDDYMTAMMEAQAELNAPKPAATTFAEAVANASHAERDQWHQAALAQFAMDHPADFLRLKALVGNDPIAIRNAIAAANDAGREQQIVYLVNRMKARGHSEADAMRIAREVIGLASDMHHRYAQTLRHTVELRLWQSRIDALPSAVRAMATESSLLLYLGAHHSQLLQDLHTRFVAQPGLAPELITPAHFEEFVARELVHHPVAQAETADRRVVRFATEADFNAAAKNATPNTRYEYKRLAYTTDEQGRVSVAEGVADRVKGHRASSALQTEIGHTGYTTDVGFHLIAHIFGAVVNELTVVAGNGKRVAGDPEPNLNGSAYKTQFENIVRDYLDNSSHIVEIQVVSIYDSGNSTSRPDRFRVRFRTDAGTWVTVPFENKH